MRTGSGTLGSPASPLILAGLAARAFAALAIAALALASCAPRLDPAGEVRLWTAQEASGLGHVAAARPGLSLAIEAATQPWTVTAGTADGPELLYLEWGGDYFDPEAFASLASLEPWRRGLAGFSALYPSVSSSLSLGPAAARSQAAKQPAPKAPTFLPATGFPWGLCYNPEVLARAGLGEPGSWKDLGSALAAIKATGATPIALGSAYGWPALAWISYVDLRLNGAAEHRRLLEGRRAFDDPSLLRVYSLLASWRDAGMFSEGAAAASWVDSTEEVVEGKAAFVLLGAGLRDRFSGTSVAFAAFPPLAGGRGQRGELASLWGFALVAGTRDPEAALSFADAYIAGAASDRGVLASEGRWRRPLSPKAAKASAATASSAADAGSAAWIAAEDGIFEKAGLLLPPLDKVLGRQASYDAGRIAGAFFAGGSTMTAAELGAALAALRPLTR